MVLAALLADIHDQYDGTNRGLPRTSINDGQQDMLAGAGARNTAVIRLLLQWEEFQWNLQGLQNNEAWNGSSWSESADVNSTEARDGGGTGASHTSAVYILEVLSLILLQVHTSAKD